MEFLLFSALIYRTGLIINNKIKDSYERSFLTLFVEVQEI